MPPKHKVKKLSKVPSASQDLFASYVESTLSPPMDQGPPATPGHDIHIEISPSKGAVFPAPRTQQQRQEPQEHSQEPQEHSQEPQQHHHDPPHRQHEPQESQIEPLESQVDPHDFLQDEPAETHTESGTDSTDGYLSAASARAQSIISMAKKVEAELAEWLQEQEFLYVRTHVDSKNTRKKDRVLEEKGKSLVPPQTLDQMKKWLHTRRTQYGRITKKIDKSGAARAELTSHKKWILTTYHFFQRHIKRQRPTKSLGVRQVCKIYQI